MTAAHLVSFVIGAILGIVGTVLLQALRINPLDAEYSEMFGDQALTVPPAVDGGWIDWSGGKQAPARGAMRVRYRDGSLSGVHLHTAWVWEHVGCGSDIMAYQVVPA